LKSNLSIKSLWNLIKEYGQPRKTIIILSLFLSIVTTLSTLAIAWMFKGLMDDFKHFGSGSSLQIIFVIIFLAILAIASGVTSIFYLGKEASRIVVNIREALWRKVNSLPFIKIEQLKKGEISSRIVNDTGIIYDMIATTFPQAINGGLQIIGALVALFLLDWQLALILLIVAPIFFVCFIPIGNIQAHLANKVQKKTAQLNQSITEFSLINIVIQSLGAVKKVINKVNKKITDIYQINVKQLITQALVNPLVNLLIIIPISCILLVGGMQLNNNVVTIGTLTSFIIFTVQLITPILSVSSIFINLKKSAGITYRITKILYYPNTDNDKDKKVLTKIDSISLSRVSFDYQNNQALHNISFNINAGEYVAIIGPSGSGKSTLLKLIDGLYHTKHGELLINTLPINQYSEESIHKEIGFVTQNSMLFNGTIKENLLLGVDNKIPDSELYKQLKLVGLYDYIKKLPKQLDTPLGELGNTLSEGQKQRLALARVLIRNNDTLLCDEITSNLDKSNATIINNCLDVLHTKQDKTIINITHRLENLNKFDKIIFLVNGQINGIGSNRNLLVNNKAYREFVEHK